MHEIRTGDPGNLWGMPMGKLPGYMLIMGMPGGGRGCSKPSRKEFFWKRGPFCAMVTCSRRSPTCNPHLR